jgi:hypothetical protein
MRREFIDPKDLPKLDTISLAAYSTRETQYTSYVLAKGVVKQNIEGCFVECGVADAGNFASMMVGATSLPEGSNRVFWGLDSFEGIQLAGKKDTVQAGIGAITHDTNVDEKELLKSSGITVHPKDQVQNNLNAWGLGHVTTHLVKGWVQNTITEDLKKKMGKIAVLRLDMDIYDPTIFTLRELWDQISVSGIIIIDDWALDGVRIAVEEFFQEKGIKPFIYPVENSTPVYFVKG